MKRKAKKNFDYPDETEGTRHSAELRARCNNLTPKEREKLSREGLKIINASKKGKSNMEDILKKAGELLSYAKDGCAACYSPPGIESTEAVKFRNKKATEIFNLLVEAGINPFEIKHRSGSPVLGVLECTWSECCNQNEFLRQLKELMEKKAVAPAS